MQFTKPVSGRILLGKRNLTTLDTGQLRQIRPNFQMIFQDSASSFNPRRTIGAAIAMPLNLLGVRSRAERINRACKMMEQVGLDPSGFGLLPHQLSGGQCQRAQIARALITEPELLICDEPVSALDVLVQAQIIHLLDGLRKHAQLTMLFISHDLSVVRHICDRIAVMYAGKICEISDCRQLYLAPRHPYSRTLLSAIPTIGKFKNDHMVNMGVMEAHPFDGSGHGCSYRRCCPQVKKRCLDEEPVLSRTGPHCFAACHFPIEKEHPSGLPTAWVFSEGT